MTRVTVAWDIFDQQGERWDEWLGDGWEASPCFLVLAEDAERAASALHTARTRLMQVNELGEEVDLETADLALYTPNCVSDVYITAIGPIVSVDTKGELPKAMADGMLRILLDELTGVGISAHVTAPPEGWVNGSELWHPPA